MSPGAPKTISSPARGRGPERPQPGSRLRVLQMIGFLGTIGGAERFALALASALPRERFETWVCAPRGGEPDAIAELERAGVRFVDLGRQGRFDYYRMAGLVSLLRRERFDVLHSHMFGSNLWASVLGRACHVPVLIAHEHTWSYEGNWLRARLDGQLVGRLTTCFVAVSAADARRMISIEGVPPEKVVVLPTAYVPSLSESSADIRRELGLDPATPLVGTATVMRPQKALDVLIAAHAEVVRALPAAHLVLAGDGELRPALEQQARSLGIEARTHFLGRRDDVDSIIRSIDVAAMSSDFEGTPLFAFECMANGTPLVATDVGGLPDIVQDGRTGLLVAPRREHELAQAIIGLLSDPEHRRQMAAAAAERLGEYTIERTASRFAELYEALALPKPSEEVRSD
jgi:glycosyltransferase involved in cell wall biosynthesis